MTYKLWGYANSWIIHGFDDEGNWVWESRWFRTPKAALDSVKDLLA